MAQVAQTAFFSYCRDDSEFALRLAEDLKAAGANVWMDQLDIEPGIAWDRAVENAVTNCPRMLVILSPTSVNSENVRDEISFALSKQKRVIPVLYRECDVPFRLARLQHIDFRTDYARGLKTLLKTLGVEQQSFAAGGSEVSAVPRESRTEEEERVAREKAKEAQMRADAERGRKEAEARARAEAERIAQQEAERAREKAEAERQHKRLEKPGKEPLTGECTEAEHRVVNEAEQAHANVEVSRVGIDEAEAGLAVQRALAEGTARNKSKKQAVETKEPQIPKRKWLDRLQVNARRKFLIYIVASTSLIAVAILALALWHRARTATPEPDQKQGTITPPGGMGEDTSAEGVKKPLLSLVSPRFALQYSLGTPIAGGGPVTFTPDGKLVAQAEAGEGASKIRIWGVPSGTLNRTLEAGDVRGIAFSQDGRFLAAGFGAWTNSPRIQIWNTSTWATVLDSSSWEKPGNSIGSVSSLAFSPTHPFFAVGTSLGLHLYAFPNFAELSSPVNRGVGYVAFSPDGRWLATSSDFNPGNVHVWDANTWTERYSVPVPKEHAYGYLTISGDAKYLAYAGPQPGAKDILDRLVSIRDFETGQSVQTLSLPSGIGALAFGLEGRVLACASKNTIILWDTKDWSEIQSLVYPPSSSGDVWITSIAFSPNGQWIATSAARDSVALRLWRTNE